MVQTYSVTENYYLSYQQLVCYLIISVKRIGCLEGRHRRVIPSVEGSDRIIQDRYRHRRDAVKKCALVAMRLRYTTFVVRRQGLCATGPEAHKTFKKHRAGSDRCRNGKGVTVYKVYG